METRSTQTRVFKARTVREALKKVSTALGADAMIVSQARRDGIVEVTARRAGVDDAPAIGLAPAPMRTSVRERLAALGLALDFVDSALSGVAATNPADAVAAARRLLPLAPRDARLAHGRIRLMGPPGAGKTTNAVRIALGHVLAHGRDSVALITEDTARLGGSEALLLAGELMDIPVLEVRDANERAEALSRLDARALIVVDTEGLGATGAMPTELPGFETIVTIPATARDDVVAAVLARVRGIAPSGVLLTQTDCVASIGATLSALWRAALPLCWIAGTTDVARGLEPADADVVWRLLGGEQWQAEAVGEPDVPAAPPRRIRELAVV